MSVVGAATFLDGWNPHHATALTPNRSDIQCFYVVLVVLGRTSAKHCHDYLICPRKMAITSRVAVDEKKTLDDHAACFILRFTSRGVQKINNTFQSYEFS